MRNTLLVLILCIKCITIERKEIMMSEVERGNAKTDSDDYRLVLLRIHQLKRLE